MSDTIVHFKKTKKEFFLNNFCVSELYTFTFPIQKETMVTQMSAASPSLNFLSGKSHDAKIKVYF